MEEFKHTLSNILFWILIAIIILSVLIIITAIMSEDKLISMVLFITGQTNLLLAMVAFWLSYSLD